ncbi:hypothetical protein KIN20_029246 [Parelaphostrongylus tenuis]|uniref:Uncharacterized protein n=1 Tax=Parelaphostrongylus tenuis TaxID=148309 RepID=A0AAD5R250_PARTN|nr:hypothetical protein KIN20_029246 [Parelaphostrongylus tenuis]
MPGKTLLKLKPERLRRSLGSNGSEENITYLEHRCEAWLCQSAFKPATHTVPSIAVNPYSFWDTTIVFLSVLA